MSKPTPDEKAVAPATRRTQRRQPARRTTSRNAFPYLFGLAAIGAIFIVLPYWVPLFLGATLATALAPLHKLIKGRLHNRPATSAMLTTLLLWGVIITPFLSLIAYGANEVASGIEWAKEALKVENLRALYAGQVPSALQSLLERVLGGFQIGPEELEKVGKGFVEVMQRTTPTIFGASLGLAGGTVLVLFSCFFMLLDGPKLIAKLEQDVPLPRMHMRELLSEFSAVATASLMGLAFTSIGQALVLTLGYWAAGLPHLFFFAVISLLGAFVPLLGTMVIWVPTSLGLFLVGKSGAALGLAIWSLISVQIVDAVLKPMLLQGRMTLHGALTFLGMLGGLDTFGPVGVIAGPMVLALFSTFIELYERDHLAKSSSRRRS